MSDSRLLPGRSVPPLTVATVGGGRFSLASHEIEELMMIVVYRGLHCPICSLYLRDLDRKLDEFAELGVDVIAVSSDSAERAARAYSDWGLKALTMGYDFDISDARQWGLYVSAGIGKTSVGIEEPELFLEPGLFLIKPDNTLYYAAVQTMPFARPSFSELLKAVEFATNKQYPARGES